MQDFTMDADTKKAFAAVENRMEATETRILERIEQTETRLLSAFHGWSTTMELRLKSLPATEQRLAVLEDRLSALNQTCRNAAYSGTNRRFAPHLLSRAFLLALPRKQNSRPIRCLRQCSNLISCELLHWPFFVSWRVPLDCPSDTCLFIQ